MSQVNQEKKKMKVLILGSIHIFEDEESELLSTGKKQTGNLV